MSDAPVPSNPLISVWIDQSRAIAVLEQQLKEAHAAKRAAEWRLFRTIYPFEFDDAVPLGVGRMGRCSFQERPVVRNTDPAPGRSEADEDAVPSGLGTHFGCRAGANGLPIWWVSLQEREWVRGEERSVKRGGGWASSHLTLTQDMFDALPPAVRAQTVAELEARQTSVNLAAPIRNNRCLVMAVMQVRRNVSDPAAVWDHKGPIEEQGYHGQIQRADEMQWERLVAQGVLQHDGFARFLPGPRWAEGVRIAASHNPHLADVRAAEPPAASSPVVPDPPPADQQNQRPRRKPG